MYYWRVLRRFFALLEPLRDPLLGRLLNGQAV